MRLIIGDEPTVPTARIGLQLDQGNAVILTVNGGCFLKLYTDGSVALINKHGTSYGLRVRSDIETLCHRFAQLTCAVK
jgi:hypothetical protein